MATDKTTVAWRWLLWSGSSHGVVKGDREMVMPQLGASVNTHDWSVISGYGSGGVWHYTSSVGLRGIVENHCLWATASTGLNDPTEVTYALDEMRRTWKHYRDSPNLVGEVPRDAVDNLVNRLGEEIESHDLFVTSGSMEGDKLEHWKEYGRDQGYAVCLQRYSIWRVRSHADETASDELSFGSPFLRWHEVDYTKFVPSFTRPLETPSGRVLKEIITAVMKQRDGSVDEHTAHEYALNAALRQLCWQKHAGYESEDEIRIAVMNPPSHTRHERPSAYGPRPVEYVELVGGDPTDHDATLLPANEPAPKLPILAVRIGPRNTPTKLAEDLNATAQLLDDNGYNVPVVASPTPFLRGR
ncbi:hypothetical protein [Rhodococcus jostii]|uniref:hypothetical protein n=1 Tax=Rhodococcus jostii TaxID=132919 RepID=UPI00364E1DA4